MKGTHKVRACLAALAAMALLTPMPAFAANGVQDGTQTFVSDGGTEKKGAWDPTANAGDGGAGQIQLVFDTTGGQWTDADGNKHANGTYQVIIPKLIKYTNMPLGQVDITTPYDVTVRGALPTNKDVRVSAAMTNPTTGKATADNTLNGSAVFMFDKTAGNTPKDIWTAAECAELAPGATAALSKVKGTTVKHSVQFKGVAKESGVYNGKVQYTAAIVSE